MMARMLGFCCCCAIAGAAATIMAADDAKRPRQMPLQMLTINSLVFWLDRNLRLL